MSTATRNRTAARRIQRNLPFDVVSAVLADAAGVRAPASRTDRVVGGSLVDGSLVDGSLVDGPQPAEPGAPARPADRQTSRRPGRRGPFRRVSLESPRGLAQRVDPAQDVDLPQRVVAAEPVTEADDGPRGPLHTESLPRSTEPALQIVGVAFTLATFLAAALWL